MIIKELLIKSYLHTCIVETSVINNIMRTGTEVVISMDKTTLTDHIVNVRAS